MMAAPLTTSGDAAGPPRTGGLSGRRCMKGSEQCTSPALMWFGHEAGDAYAFVAGLLGWMLDGLGDDQRSRALDALGATIGRHQTPGGVCYESRAWLILARRA
jgi:hypothetical protein